MLSKRAALAAIVAAGLWGGALGQAAAQSLAQSLAESPAPAGDQQGVQKPPEGSSQKPAEGSTQKPSEDSTQKRAEEGAPKSKLVSILGREVTNREGDSGRVIDVLVDPDGHSGAVVVEFGGFMGIGSRKVAVDWSAMHFVRDGNRTALVVDITRDQIRDAAEYKPNEPTNVLSTK